jgi:hypothetical protein
MLGSDVRGLSPSAAALPPSKAIRSDCGSDVCAIISIGCRGSPTKASGVELSIEEVSTFALPFVWSIHASIHASMVHDVVRCIRNEIRDSVIGGKDVGELGREERGGDNDDEEKSEMVMEEIVVAKGRQFS